VNSGRRFVSGGLCSVFCVLSNPMVTLPAAAWIARRYEVAG
jgi:hypothetical protein